MEDYEKKAEDFLKETQTEFKAEFLKEYPNKGIRTEKEVFKRRFSAGLIKDWTRTGREVLTDVWLEVTIKEIDLSTEVIFNAKHKVLKIGNTKQTNNLINVQEYKILSISGNTLSSAGQIKDILTNKDFKPKKGFNVKGFLEIWKEYHLNDCTAGTLRQEEVLNKWKERPTGFSYTEDGEYLKRNKLLIDRGYKYGSKWLIREFPQEVEDKLKQIIKNIKQ